MAKWLDRARLCIEGIFRSCVSFEAVMGKDTFSNMAESTACLDPSKRASKAILADSELWAHKSSIRIGYRVESQMTDEVLRPKMQLRKVIRQS
jgi:hypothetical protein